MSDQLEVVRLEKAFAVLLGAESIYLRKKHIRARKRAGNTDNGSREFTRHSDTDIELTGPLGVGSGPLGMPCLQQRRW